MKYTDLNIEKIWKIGTHVSSYVNDYFSLFKKASICGIKKNYIIKFNKEEGRQSVYCGKKLIDESKISWPTYHQRLKIWISLYLIKVESNSSIDELDDFSYLEFKFFKISSSKELLKNFLVNINFDYPKYFNEEKTYNSLFSQLIYSEAISRNNDKQLYFDMDNIFSEEEYLEYKTKIETILGFNEEEKRLKKYKFTNKENENKKKEYYKNDAREFIRSDVYNIYNLFIGRDLGSSLHVPIYQRKYSWKKERVRSLMKDIFRIYNGDDTHHFLGNLILGHGNELINHHIIDGQQRITTTIIILKVIYNMLAAEGLEIDRDVARFIYNDNNFSYLEYVSGNNEGDKLSQIFQNNKEENKTIDDKFHNSMKVIEEEITMFLRNEKNEYSQKGLDKLLEIFLTKLIFNITFHSKVKDQIFLFEKINTSSQPLLNIDLLKNKMLSFISSKDLRSRESDIQNLFENSIFKWFKNDSKKSKKGDDDVSESLANKFFKYIFTVFRIEKDSSFIDGLNNLLTEYFDFDDDMNYSDFVSSIREFGKEISLFILIDTYNTSKHVSGLEEIQDSLYMFSGREIYFPLIREIIFNEIVYSKENSMNVWSFRNRKFINKIRRKLLLLEKFEMQLQVANFRGQSLRDKISRIIDDYKNENNSFDKIMKEASTGSFSVSKKQFEEELLKKIKDKIAVKLINRVEFWSKNGYNVDDYKENDFDFKTKFTREHIMPKEGEKWVKNLSDFYKKEDISKINELYNENLDRLGNSLVLSKSINSKIKNNLFFKKGSEYDNQPKVNFSFQYDSDEKYLISIKKLLNKQENFNFETIQKRTEQLKDLIIKIYYS